MQKQQQKKGKWKKSVSVLEKFHSTIINKKIISENRMKKSSSRFSERKQKKKKVEVIKVLLSKMNWSFIKCWWKGKERKYDKHRKNYIENCRSFNLHYNLFIFNVQGFELWWIANNSNENQSNWQLLKTPNKTNLTIEKWMR